MQLSINNHFTDTGTLTVSSDDDTTQTKANMEDISFSNSYTSLGSSANFYIQKTFTGFTCGYIAIMGHNIGVNGATITLKCNNSTVDTIVIPAGAGNHVIMSTFSEVSSVTDIDIEIVKNVTADQITITSIAAGQYMDVPNGGEQGGYPRLWLTRNKRQKAISNDTAGPVAILSQSITRKATLQVNAALLSFVEGSDWQELLDMAFDLGYFIAKEHDGSITGISDDPLTSYLCFNCEVDPPHAHAASRKLVTFSIGFNAYTGV